MEFWKKVISLFYKKSIIYVAGLDNIPVYEINTNYKICNITKSVMGKLTKEQIEDLTSRKFNIFKERLNKNNNKGFFVVDNYTNKLIGYFWLSCDEIEEGTSGYKKKIDKDSIYLFDVLIFSEYRAKGITNLIFSYLKNFMKDNKKLNCYTIVDNTNFKSKNMVIKNGFLKIGYFITIKFKDKRKIIVDTWR